MKFFFYIALLLQFSQKSFFIKGVWFPNAHSRRSKHFHLVSEQRKTGFGRTRNETRATLFLAPFFARSLTLVPHSLLLNRMETLATQAKMHRIITSCEWSNLSFNLMSVILILLILYLHKENHMYDCNFILNLLFKVLLQKQTFPYQSTQ